MTEERSSLLPRLCAKRNLGELKESGMNIRIGDKIRHALTDEEGAVVAVPNNTPT
jgi:hypothetical protein